MAHLKEVKTTTRTWSAVPADCLVTGVTTDLKLSGLGQQIDAALDGILTAAIKGKDITGKAKEVTVLFGKDHRILVVGLGDPEKIELESVRIAGGTAAATAIARKYGRLLFDRLGAEYFEDLPAVTQALTEGIILGSYQFLDYKTDDKDLFLLKSAVILDAPAAPVRKGSLIAAGVCFARDLGNRPGNVVTPTYLAQAAEQIAREGDMQFTVFDREKFTAMGMGALAAVASGSAEPPQFIVLEYRGAAQSVKPVALAGKGLTFDSGGISIKPSAGMDEMKFDMCGAAVVLGIMKIIAALRPKLNIVGVIPSTENLSGSKAYKPGDILTAYNKKTIEVLNTDAEGRLILADALAYLSKHYQPEFIFDFATLTGAVVIALGHVATGVLGTDRALLDRVFEAARISGEKFWELPLWDEYCEHVKSRLADVKNVGNTREAGTIAGAAFLKEFVGEGIPWVHFDIAGTAWENREKPYTPKNTASGAVIRTVLEVMGV